ncbi:hypothetical protein [Peribacillus frigoritolerans]|uniref:hypothetical protein n=1 Tax=Peribacillus frigoritolerans TaxID=450367 RepID=UPI002570311A|nr:hypothetical protein [Peribacillus frigoritolerans]
MIKSEINDQQENAEQAPVKSSIFGFQEIKLPSGALFYRGSQKKAERSGVICMLFGSRLQS